MFQHLSALCGRDFPATVLRCYSGTTPIRFFYTSFIQNTQLFRYVSKIQRKCTPFVYLMYYSKELKNTRCFHIAIASLSWHRHWSTHTYMLPHHLLCLKQSKIIILFHTTWRPLNYYFWVKIFKCRFLDTLRLFALWAAGGVAKRSSNINPPSLQSSLKISHEKPRLNKNVTLSVYPVVSRGLPFIMHIIAMATALITASIVTAIMK